MATATLPTETTLPAEIKKSSSAAPPAGSPGEDTGTVWGSEKFASGLGWLHIGAGIAELLLPDAVYRVTGKKHRGLLARGDGIRRITKGVGLLRRRRSPAATTRRDAPAIAGPVAAPTPRNGTEKSGSGPMIAAAVAVGGAAALGVLWWQSSKRARSGAAPERNLRAEASAIVNCPPAECYAFWRDFENFPRFMSYLRSVRITSDTHSHWILEAPAHGRIEWDAEVGEDTPNQRITWASLPGSDVSHAGSVEFTPAPGDRGTIVRVQIDYGHSWGHPGAATSLLARLVGKDPEQLVHKDLRRFKQLIETGEVITTEGQSAGRGSGTTLLDNIAR